MPFAKDTDNYNEEISDQIDLVRRAIQEKKPLIAQQIVITILESVTVWIETVERKIYNIKQSKSPEDRKSKHRHIYQEILIIEEKLINMFTDYI